jgi:ABC-2 type transport system permease protein
MWANVFTKTTVDRWRGVVIGAITMVLFLWMAMVVYRDIDLSIYTDLPEVFRSVVGIDETTDVGSLAYSAVYSSYGALVMFSLALAMGSAAIAGEERKGTIGLLLANPTSRTGVLLAKAASLALLLAFGIGLLWLGGLLVPQLLDVGIAGQDIGALMLHMFAGALFFGFLALAVGAWTGSTGAAIGVSAGVMVLSFFAVGFLPLFSDYAELARVFPWYYFSSSDPLANGIDAGHLAVLALGSVVLLALAVVGVSRRDLRESSTGVTLLDRLRALPATKAVMNRLAGSARVSAIWIKTAAEYQGLLLIVGLSMFLVMGVLIGVMYSQLDDELLALGDSFPAELLALFGGGDLSTIEGYYQLETFGLMAPIAVMIATILIGARAVAGEEQRRTMGLLLANPVPRSRVLLEKAFVMVLFGLAIGLITFLGVAAGNALGQLDMNVGNVAATSFLVALLGIVFGAVALLVGAATGRSRIAIWTAVGLALLSHLGEAFLPFSENFADLARWLPNHYYLTTDPLLTGMDWGSAAVLTAIAATLIAVSVPAFNRRDLREHD